MSKIFAYEATAVEKLAREVLGHRFSAGRYSVLEIFSAEGLEHEWLRRVV